MLELARFYRIDTRRQRQDLPALVELESSTIHVRRPVLAYGPALDYIEVRFHRGVEYLSPIAGVDTLNVRVVEILDRFPELDQ